MESPKQFVKLEENYEIIDYTKHVLFQNSKSSVNMYVMLLIMRMAQAYQTL